MTSISIRIDLAPNRRIGPGKIALLEKIAASGSISAGGRAMGMSYKRAWALVDEIGRLCGRPVVVSKAGGRHGGGATLTDFAISLVARYRAIENAVEAAASSHLDALRRDIEAM